MREILGQYKYRGNERLAPLLGLMLDRAYAFLQYEQSGQQLNGALQSNLFSKLFPVLHSKLRMRSNLWQADLLVPVPVSAVRLSERGFNQAERLAEVVSLHRGVPQLPLLVRTHHTAKQSFKSRRERLADMKHAFAGNTDPVVLQSLKELLNSSMTHQLEQRPCELLLSMISTLREYDSCLRRGASAALPQPGLHCRDILSDLGAFLAAAAALEFNKTASLTDTKHRRIFGDHVILVA